VKAPDKKAEKAASGKKSKVGLIILIIVIMLVLGFVALLVFNVFGFRDNVIMPFLRNVPVIGSFISDSEEEDLTPEQRLQRHINELEAQVDNLQTQLDEALTNVEPLEEDLEILSGELGEALMELAILREFHQQYMDFLVRVEAFDRQVVTDSEGAFIAWFDRMHPDRAEEIYAELTMHRIQDEERAAVIAVWTSISPQSAASAIEEMARTNMTLIVGALSDMPPSNAGSIMNLLSPETRAAILRMMD